MTERLELISRIQGESDTAGSVVLVNISEGGLLIHTDHELQVGETHEFRFHLRAGPPLLFVARVVRRLAVDDGLRQFAVGLALEQTATARQKAAIHALREFADVRPMDRQRPS
ncbi:MAG: PilZ domain-containing protein [Vicinamibacterales bacterium]